MSVAEFELNRGNSIKRINFSSTPADLRSWDKVVGRLKGFLALGRARRVSLSEAGRMLGVKNAYAYVEGNKDLLIREGGEVGLSGLAEHLVEMVASQDERPLRSNELAVIKAVNRLGTTSKSLVLRRTSMRTVTTESRWLLAPYGIYARGGNKHMEYHPALSKLPDRSRDFVLRALLAVYANQTLSGTSIRSIEVDPSPGDIEETFDVTVYPYCGAPQLGTCSKAKVIPVSSSREVIELANRRTPPDIFMIAPESRELGHLIPTDHGYRLLAIVKIPYLYLMAERTSTATNNRKEKAVAITPARKELWLFHHSSAGSGRQARIVQTPRQQLEAYLQDENLGLFGKNLLVILGAVNSLEHNVLYAVRSDGCPHLLEIWARDTMSTQSLSHIAWVLHKQIEFLQRRGLYKAYFDALMLSPHVREWLQLTRRSLGTDPAAPDFSGVSEICPECGSTALQFDYEWVCTNCGSVIHEIARRNGHGSSYENRGTQVRRRTAIDQTVRQMLSQDRRLQRVPRKFEVSANELKEIERHSRVHIRDMKSAFNTMRIYVKSARASCESDRKKKLIRDWPSRILALAVWGKQFCLENGIPMDGAFLQLLDLPWFRNKSSRADFERATCLAKSLEVPAEYMDALRAVLEKGKSMVPLEVADYLLSTDGPLWNATRRCDPSSAAGFAKKSRNRKRGSLGMVAATYNWYSKAYRKRGKGGDKSVAKQFGISTATLFKYERVIFQNPELMRLIDARGELDSLRGGFS